MSSYQPLDLLPIWGVFIFTIILLLLTDQAGYQLGRLLRNHWPDRSESSVGAMVGASLAFLGFLLAFITGVAVNIFIERRQLVIQEANAIGTVYLRAGYLDEPYSTKSRKLLREYVDARLVAFSSGEKQAALTRSEQIQTELWSQAETVARNSPTPTISLYITSLNEVIDLGTERLNAELGIRVPPIILLGIYLVATLTMLLIGIQSSYAGSLNYIALVIMIIILAIVILIIVDLDRSRQGLIQVPQKALLDLQQQLQNIP